MKDSKEKEDEVEEKGTGKSPEEPTEEEKEVSEEEQSEEKETNDSALDKVLEDPELKAEYDARIQEAVDAALAAAGAEEDGADEEVEVQEEESEAEGSEEKKEKDYEAREKALLARELRATAIEELSREQLPAALADCFNYESEETYKQTKEKVTKAFQDAMKEAVNARLRGKKVPGTSDEGAGSGNARKNTFSNIIRDQKRRR